MTHRGPFQPLPFCDYVILCNYRDKFWDLDLWLFSGQRGKGHVYRCNYWTAGFPSINCTLQRGSRVPLKGGLLQGVWYLKGAYTKDGERLFTKACSDRAMFLN